MATNMRNYGTLEGRLVRDPAVFENKDGSKKVRVTVAVENNYESKDGKRHSQFIQAEAFVRSDASGLGVYEHINEGDLVGLLVHMESDQYEKDGQTVYAQKVVIDQVDFKEPRAVTQARKQEKSAQRAGNAAGVPVVGGSVAGAQMDQSDSPFGG